MNTKRQTIWLVSMLSLMVVLSAYYLFTEDVNKLNLTTDKVAQQEDIKVTTEVKDPAAAGQTDKAVSGTAKTTDSKATDKNAVADAQVIQKLQTQGKTGAEFFTALGMQRDEELHKLTEKLMGIMASDKSDAEIVKATEELDKLQTKQAKVENIEDVLGKDFKNVIVLEEGKNFKVVVQADKLEKSQAVSIVDLVIKELNVAKDHVSVQIMH